MVPENIPKKYLKIAEIIKDNIIKGIYPVGENIPTVKQLSEIYQVNPQTISKATAYLSSLGYLNPRQGSGLKVCLPGQKSAAKSIAMVVDRSRSQLIDLEKIGNYHYRDIYLSYLKIAQEKNIKSGFIVYDNNDQTINNEFLQGINHSDGLIIQGQLPTCYYQYLQENNLPIVLINRCLPPNYKKRIGNIMISDNNIASLINYLISLGHHKLIYAVSLDLEKNIIKEERYQVMLETCAKWTNGPPIEVEIFEFMPQQREYAEKLKNLYDNGFKAAWAYNDISALGLYSLVRMNQKTIPYDFSITGFDDIPASQIADPPLTTIHVNRFKLIEFAMQILDRLLISTTDIQITETLNTELIIRQSAYVNR